MALVQGGPTGRSLKHVAIREYVRDLVRDSPPGAAAPSERDLVDRFGVARMTVRQALDALVVEGVLERVPGRGTFVAGPRRVPTGVSSFTEEMSRRGLATETRTILIECVPARETISTALRIQPGEPVVHWRRLRLVDGRAVCLSDTFLPEILVHGLVDHPPASLYDELAARGRRPGWAEDGISAATSSAEEAALLDMVPGDVVLRHCRRALWGETVVEVSRSVYRGNEHTFSLQLSG